MLIPTDSLPVNSLAAVDQPEAEAAGFEVKLDNFSGPFDVLLGLISKHQLDITEVALATVTDDFIAYIKAAENSWDLDQASEFLLIAATLLDLKAARLLPNANVEDDEDLALLEARDLLFARLLQYRAYKHVAADMARSIEDAARRFPRSVSLEEPFSSLLPELVMKVSADDLARIAAGATRPKNTEPEEVGLTHLHAPPVSVKEQVHIIADRLRRGPATFRVLTVDAESLLVVVARFLAILELFREGLIGLDQAEALGELTVHWTAESTTDIDVVTDFDTEEESNRDDI